MIPFIRSHLELMALTESRDMSKKVNIDKKINSSYLDSVQRKRYIQSHKNREVGLPNLPKIIRRKWVDKKASVSRFIDELDYNNQIQKSYELTLLDTQNKRTYRDVA